MAHVITARSSTPQAGRTRIRFSQQEQAFRDAPETMEQVLPAKKKLIVDSAGGRRHLLFLEDGAVLPSAAVLRD